MAKTKTKKKKFITILIILVALLVGAAIFYYSWQKSEKADNNISKDQITEDRKEPESATDWSQDSVKEQGEKEIVKDSSFKYLYTSKEYRFGFSYSQVSVTWNALTTKNVNNNIQLSFFNNGSWGAWKDYDLKLVFRDTLYSTGDISNVLGSGIKFKLSAGSDNAKINDFSLVVGGEKVENIFIKEIDFSDD